MEAASVRIRLICENPPPAKHAGRSMTFGMQDKLGSVLAGEPRGEDVLAFECDLDVKQVDGAPQFVGVYAHGTPRDRFLYLSYGYIVADQWQWTKRLKIKLSSITAEQIEQAQRGAVIEGRVDGRGSGTVPLLGAGWNLAE